MLAQCQRRKAQSDRNYDRDDKQLDILFRLCRDRVPRLGRSYQRSDIRQQATPVDRLIERTSLCEISILWKVEDPFDRCLFRWPYPIRLLGHKKIHSVYIYIYALPTKKKRFSFPLFLSLTLPYPHNQRWQSSECVMTTSN